LLLLDPVPHSPVLALLFSCATSRLVDTLFRFMWTLLLLARSFLYSPDPWFLLDYVAVPVDPFLSSLFHLFMRCFGYNQSLSSSLCSFFSFSLLGPMHSFFLLSSFIFFSARGLFCVAVPQLLFLLAVGPSLPSNVWVPPPSLLSLFWSHRFPSYPRPSHRGCLMIVVSVRIFSNSS